MTVPVFGCVWTGHESWVDCVLPVTRTYVHVPGTEWFLEESVRTYHSDHLDSLEVVFRPEYFIEGTVDCVPIVMGAMELPLARLVSMIDRWKFYRCPLSPMRASNRVPLPDVRMLREFRDSAIRTNAAAKTVQRRFRESISDPAYAMCRRRLLREFRELQVVY